jgi:hypothetical protein
VKRWLLVIAVVWGLVIAGLAYYSIRTGRPTARDQTTIGSALPVVDTALADFAATLDPAATVAVLAGYTELSHDCRITVIRRGARYERVLLVYTKVGAERAVLDRMAAGVPKRYKVRVARGTTVQTLTADAGNFVLIQGGVDAPGQVRISADTGCRALDAPVPSAASSTTSSAPADRAPVQAVLDALRLQPVRWLTQRIACPRGGTLWTVEAEAGAAPGPLAVALGGATEGAAVVLARPDVYAYRTGPAGVAVRQVDAGLSITSTTGC